MLFKPDILVKSKDGPEIFLVGEVKLSLSARTIQQTNVRLKEYMVAMKCSTGFLISPIRLIVLRDNFYLQGTESIEQVADIVLEGIFPEFERDLRLRARTSRKKASMFEKSVFDWLDGLLVKNHIASSSVDLKRIISNYIIPALEEGELWAAKPTRMELEVGGGYGRSFY